MGYVGAAATKSMVLGLIILATARLFVPLEVLHPLTMITFLVLTAVTFSLFGFIIGIWADGFERLQMIPLLKLAWNISARVLCFEKHSMVSLARKKSDILEPSLIKMSELLRYMLYEKDDSKIAVEKEIQYLDNYIALQQLRFGKKIAIQFDHSACQDNHLIEPMLLIPFAC